MLILIISIPCFCFSWCLKLLRQLKVGTQTLSQLWMVIWYLYSFPSKSCSTAALVYTESNLLFPLCASPSILCSYALSPKDVPHLQCHFISYVFSYLKICTPSFYTFSHLYLPPSTFPFSFLSSILSPLVDVFLQSPCLFLLLNSLFSLFQSLPLLLCLSFVSKSFPPSLLLSLLLLTHFLTHSITFLSFIPCLPLSSHTFLISSTPSSIFPHILQSFDAYPPLTTCMISTPM